MIRDPSQSPDDNKNRAEPLKAEEPGSRTARGRRHRSLRDNQERLGVSPEHKTETMRKRQRGTFP